jgi:membrane protease YdiL (CAAX protease family)
MPPAPSPLMVAAGLVAIIFLASSLAAWAWAIVRLASGRPLLPWSRPRLVPWGAWSIGGVIILYMAVQLLTVMAFGMVNHRVKGQRLDPRELMTLVAASNAVILLLVPAFLRATSRAGVDDLGFASPRPAADLWRGIVGWVMLTPVVNLVMVGLVKLLHIRPRHPVEDLMKGGLNGPVMLLTLLSAVVLAPAAEELLFRGVLLGWLVKLWTGSKPTRGPQLEEDVLFLDDLPVLTAVDYEDHRARIAQSPWEPSLASIAPPRVEDPPPEGPTGLALWLPNVTASIVFAALHAPQWPAPIPLFFLSLGLGYLYIRTGNLLAPFTLHALFNGTSTAALFVSLWTHRPAS